MVVLPSWSIRLANFYVVIRIDGRNSAIRRRWYRKVEKEKLRLAELGVYQPHIRAVARYLSSVRYTRCDYINKTLQEPQIQKCFDFT